MNQNPTEHPLLIRITHWINFPVLLIMMWSGVLIYWANDIYWPQIPSSVYGFFDLKQRLADGMAYHFAFMWIFTINGLIYVGYLLTSGKWRDLAPTRRSFSDAWRVVLYDLRLAKTLPAQGKYNGAQKILYSIALVMGAVAVLTGFAMYKPVQLGFLKTLMGGYSTARLIHYLVFVGFLFFIFIHVVQVVRSGWTHFAAIVTGREGRRSTRSFVVLALFLLAVAGLLYGLKKSALDNNIPRPLRTMLDFNAQLGFDLVSTEKVDRISAKKPVRGKKARANGDAGLEGPIDLESWRLHVVSESLARTESNGVEFDISQIKSLPKTEVTVEFKCIEGWSEVMSFAGVSFLEFLRTHRLGTKSGRAIDLENNPDDVYKYVGLKTPDGQYYVAIDMKSALNPQTLLAYEQNGEPLSLEHGAPLRLYIPNKYGVKSLKRIGTITFTDRRPPDYWQEDGYDWFIGL